MSTAGLLLLIAGAVLSTALTLIIRRLSTRLRFLDEPDGRKTHARAVPYGGGIALFLATALPLAAVAVTVLAAHASGRPAWLPRGIWREGAVHVPGAALKLPQLGVVLSGGVVLCVLGIVDDRRRLGPVVKLVVQLAVAVAVTMAGIRVSAFLNSELLGAALTVVWIIVITNAFNFMDNMDGLSAGVALIISCVFVVVACASGQLFIALTLLPFVGALAGFIPFNIAPASIFMGDAGSLFIGYFLAVLSVLFTFYSGPTASFRPFVLPLIIFAVPIYDAASVTIIRLKERRSPLSGDRRHLSHRLVALGLSERLAVAAIHLLTLGISLAGVLLYLVEGNIGEVITIAQTLVLLAVMVVIERAIRS